jgi:hypothetical protein
VDRVAGACPTVANPLGGAAKDRDYNNYNIVKTSFDSLNYNLFPNPGYRLNPYAQLIHGDSPPWLGIPCAYAYSVDDAQGNVQAEGRGFIVDVGDTINLENTHKCNPPINIILGYDAAVTPRFYKYAVCQNTRDRIKPVIPGFASFDISAQDPQKCPIYLWDNANGDINPSGAPKGNSYTFRVVTDGDPKNLAIAFPLIPVPANQNWTAQTSAKIGCMGNASNLYSAKLWCCTKNAVIPPDPNAGSGVFAFSQPIVAAHATLQRIAKTTPAVIACTDPISCHKPADNFQICNTDQ